MAQYSGRFGLVRKGYDTSSVDRELREINAELVRLSEQNQDLTAQLRALSTQLLESEAALSISINPNFAALGAKAATLLNAAQQMAAELKSESKTKAQIRLNSAEEIANQMAKDAEANYEEVAQEAQRRVQRRLGQAEGEASQIIREATQQAEAILRAAEIDAAQARGSVATEVAGLRATAKREVQAARTALESDFAQKVHLALSESNSVKKAAEMIKAAKMAEIQVLAADRAAEAQADYLARHQEAVTLTESYLKAAQQELAQLRQQIAQSRLEVETLELAAATTQQKRLEEAREKAESLIHAAEIEARQNLKASGEKLRQLEEASNSRLTLLKNQSEAIEIYLNNLRSLVLDQVTKRDGDDPEQQDN